MTSSDPCDPVATARTFAERKALSFWIWMGYLYVDDGGRRGIWGVDGVTVDGELWELGPGCTCSGRPATELEVELWKSLGGP